MLVILELMRSAVMTIVELRKFEIRRRLVGGDFNRSRIRKQSSANKDPLHFKKEKKKPSLPTVPPKKPPKHPPPPPSSFNDGPPGPELDEASLGMPPVSRPGFLPAQSGDMPFMQTAGGAGLPVGPPPPPPGRPPGRPPPIGPGSMGAAPPGVPHLDLRGPPMSANGSGPRIGQVGGAGLMPGKLSGRHGRSPGGTPPMGNTPPMPGTPTLGMSSTLGQTPPLPPLSMPSGKAGGMPPSPSGSVASQMSKSLSQKMAANRMSGATPPPPAPGARGPTPPGSHRSGGSGAARPPPAPPPAGQSAVERSRAAKRGQ